jgi:hypothetical protein
MDLRGRGFYTTGEAGVERGGALMVAHQVRLTMRRKRNNAEMCRLSSLGEPVRSLLKADHCHLRCYVANMCSPSGRHIRGVDNDMCPNSCNNSVSEK